MTLEEVKDQTCKDYLTSMFGIEVDNIDNDFETFDENNWKTKDHQSRMKIQQNVCFLRIYAETDVTIKFYAKNYPI